MKAPMSTVLVAVFLAACTVPTNVDLMSVRSGDVTTSLEISIRSAISDGVLPVLVRGTPFAERTAAFVPGQDTIVVESLRMPGGFPATEIVPLPEADADKQGHLVLVFDAKDPGLDLRILCRDADAVELSEPAGASERVRVSAAFCIGQKFAWGAEAATTRPEAMTKQFEKFMNDLLSLIFPSDVLVVS